MSDNEAPQKKRRKPPWRLAGATLIVAALLLIWLNWHRLIQSGLPFFSATDISGSSTDTPKPTETTQETLQGRNVVTIRNEVYLLNDQEMSVEEMKALLPRLKVKHPDCTIEIKLFGNEKIGMKTALEKMIRANRIKLISQ